MAFSCDLSDTVIRDGGGVKDLFCHTFDFIGYRLALLLKAECHEFLVIRKGRSRACFGISRQGAGLTRYTLILLEYFELQRYT